MEKLLLWSRVFAVRRTNHLFLFIPDLAFAVTKVCVWYTSCRRRSCFLASIFQALVVTKSGAQLVNEGRMTV